MAQGASTAAPSKGQLDPSNLHIASWRRKQQGRGMRLTAPTTGGRANRSGAACTRRATSAFSRPSDLSQRTRFCKGGQRGALPGAALG